MTAFDDRIRTLARHAARLRAGRAAASRRAPLDLAVFTDERADNPARIVEALPPLPGIRLAVIFRHYAAPDRESLGASLAAVCRLRGLRFLVAGDAALALRLRADGLHFPEWQIDKIRGLKRLYPGWIMSAACHSLPALLRAEDAGADCAFLSPVFSTASHAGETALGERNASMMAAQVRLPILALGGVGANNAGKIKPGIWAGFGAIDAFSRL